MAVTPPGSYARISTGPAGPFAHGAEVGPSLASLGANHNHLYAAMGTPVGAAFYGEGWEDNGNWDLLFRRPADPDRRTLQCSVYAANANGAAQTIRVHDGATTADISLASGGPAWASVTWAPSSTSQGPIVVQVRDPTGAGAGDIKVYAVLIHRTVLSGSLSDAPKSSGWRWAQSAEFGTEEPVHVEMFNRMLAGPRLLQAAQPVVAWSLVDAPGQGRFGLADSASEATLLAGSAEDGEGVHAWGLGGLSYNWSGRLWVAARQRFGTVDATVTVSVGGHTVVCTFDGGTATPTSPGPYQWQSADLDDLPAGLLPISLSVRGGEVFAAHLLAR